LRALVTGATGFVGHWVAKALIDEGTAVRVLARPESDRRNLIGLQVEVAEGDLRDRESLDAVLQGCEELYHVAAFYSSAEDDCTLLYEINVGGTKAILKAARRAGVQRIVHTSTIGAIGRPADGGLPTEEAEFDLWDVSSHYAKSKYLAEVVARLMAQDGLPIVIVNPCSPIGAGDVKPTSSGQRIVDYLSGRVPTYLEGGINLVAVRDVAAGHLLAARRGRPGQRYLLGNLEGNLRREDFYQMMELVSGVKPPPMGGHHPVRRLLRSPERRSTAPASLVCRPARAVEELGLPQTSVVDALREAVQWFGAHGYVKNGYPGAIR
jgi:dihydroflavonol-4-reductase